VLFRGSQIRHFIKEQPWLVFRGTLACCLLLWTLFYGFSCSSEQASHIVRYYGYYVNLLLFGGLIAYLGLSLWSRSSAISAWFVQWRVGAFAAGSVLLASSVVFYQADLDYKIAMDDYLLAATAKSLHETGEVAVAQFGQQRADGFHVLQSFVDKRPWFYPFLVSMVHDVLGYSTLHPFVVNAVCGVVLLICVFWIAYYLAGIAGAVLAVLLWASVPLLQQNATGGGMETLNLLMLHLVILQGILYLRAPSSRGEGALCLSGVLLTYCRYESGIFLGAILLIVVLGWWRRRTVFLSWGAVSAAPLLLAVLLQTRIYAGTASSWEIFSGAEAPFALSHFLSNLPHVFMFFWSRDPAIANSLLLGALALPALFAYLVVSWKQRGGAWWRTEANQVWAVFALFILISLVVVLCFHAAQFDKRYVARYSLPAHALIIFCGLSALSSIKRPAWIYSILIGSTLLFLYFVTLPKNGAALYSKANYIIAEQHWLEGIDTSLMAEDALIVDRISTPWTLRERAVLPPGVVLQNLGTIQKQYNQSIYSEIYLVERSGDYSAQLSPEQNMFAQLKQAFVCEPIASESFRAGALTQVYRLSERVASP
jgi:hypothetical protein